MSRFWSPDFPFAPARLPFFYGWVIVAAAATGIVFSIPGQTMGFSVFTDVMMAELGLSRVQLSLAYCLGTLLSGFTLPRVGRLYDILGGRRMAVFASLATGAILFYLSIAAPLAREIASLTGAGEAARATIAFIVITLGFYLLRAAAQGVLTMSGWNVIGKWFDFHRGTALALSGAVTAFCFSLAPKFLDSLIEAHGYAATWRGIGVVTATGMAALAWALYRDNPEECGLPMDGRAGGKPHAKAHADSLTHRDLTRREALRTWAFWAFNLSLAFFALFSTAFTFHVVSIATEAGRTKDAMLSLFVPMALLSVVTNLGVGWLSPRIRLKYLAVLMNAGALAGVFGVMNVATAPGAVAYVVGNGICGGCFSALTGIVWPRFFGRLHLGAISGMAMSSMVIASGLGPILFSLSLAATGSYTLILWISALIPAALLVGAFRADNPQRRFAPAERG